MNREIESREPVIEEAEQTAEPQETEDTLNAALQKLTITGIMPKTGTVLIGGRTLRVGQTLVIHHENVHFRLRLSKVSGNQIEFADVKNNRDCDPASKNPAPRCDQAKLRLRQKTPHRRPTLFDRDGGQVTRII